MKTVTQHLRDHILINKMNYEALVQSEWSPKFETYMRNRLIVGALRYGPIHFPDKPVYDRISYIIERAEEYKKTGNDELLVDIANYALLEFEEGMHPNKHFKSVDDGKHIKQKEEPK